MRNIVFTSRKVPNNSFEMRGVRMCAELVKLGYKASCIAPEELGSVKESLVVWVRRVCGERQLKGVISNGNINIYDPLDRIDELRNKRRVYENVHAVIYASKTQEKQAKNNDILKHKLNYHLLHHWDSNLKRYRHNHFQLGYWGYRTSAVNVYNFVRKKNRFTSARIGEYPPEHFFKNISCHYSVRNEERGLGWRPTTKISTAAACGCNIILSRDDISMELLPVDYPYFVDGYGYDETKAMIEYAKETYGTDIWKYGLECMDKVRMATGIKRCAKLYIDILNDIDGKI